MSMQVPFKLSFLFLIVLLFTSCRYKHPQISENWDLTDEQKDSLYFALTRHYTVNYNFTVIVDSLQLKSSPPKQAESFDINDSCTVYQGNKLVVASILPLNPDSLEKGYYIKVAHDQEKMGWISEDSLLAKTVPCDPISQFIHSFSNKHMQVFCILLAAAALFYLYQSKKKKRLPIVHFNDIDSLYPSLFCLLTALAATLYGSMQAFVPETWKEYYFNPTLNPFGQPFILAAFLSCVWLMLLTFLASLDDIHKQLNRSEAVTYILGLGCIWLLIYLLFSFSVQIYIGYIFLIAYIVFALHSYLHHYTAHYVCGQCGKPLHDLGRCPHCGAINK